MRQGNATQARASDGTIRMDGGTMLRVHSLTFFDRYPLETLDAKRHRLSQTAREGWLSVFGHGVEQKAGYLTRRQAGLRVVPHDVEANPYCHPESRLVGTKGLSVDA